LALPAQATLIDRGVFNDGLGGSMNLIYDDDLNITWLGDANFGAGSTFGNGTSSTDGQMTWQNAVNWAGSLTVGGFTDWRLPTTTQPDASCGGQFNGGAFGPQGLGSGCTGSEMGHLFNVEDITAVAPGMFSNVQPTVYWSGTEFAPGTYLAWSFIFLNGIQLAFSKSFHNFAWAVRSGDVSAPAAVPESGTMLLMGSGLVGLLAWRRLRRG